MLQPCPVLEPGRPVDSRGAQSKGHGTFCEALEGKDKRLVAWGVGPDLQEALYTGDRIYKGLVTLGIGSTRGRLHGG